MKRPLLLDTCALIWIADGQELLPSAIEAIRCAQDEAEAIYVSPISAWEIGMLVSRSRLHLQMSPSRWFQKVSEIDGVKLAEMSADILISSSFLPGTPPRDPADRILAATTRERGYRLMTRDNLLLAYGLQGHIQVVAC